MLLKLKSMVKNYIQNNKPILSPKSKYSQGYFKPKYPEKYLGNVENIIFRSGLEKRWFSYFDNHPSIISWNCEEFIVRYLNPIDNKLHRYYIDVYIKYKTKKNEIREAIIEIKPLTQVKKPVMPKSNRKTRGFVYAVNQYIVNVSKWNTAKLVAEEKGIEFKILCETGFLDWKIQKLDGK